LKKDPSSSQPLRSMDPSKELAKTLSYLNLKDIEIEKHKRLVSEQNYEIKSFREQSNDKDKIITQY
jgi:hypothetical protein